MLKHIICITHTHTHTEAQTPIHICAVLVLDDAIQSLL